jgi:hypothetical protein
LDERSEPPINSKDRAADMSKPHSPKPPTTKQKVAAEIADSVDEELELELDGDRLLELMDGFADNPDTDNPARTKGRCGFARSNLIACRRGLI